MSVSASFAVKGQSGVGKADPGLNTQRRAMRDQMIDPGANQRLLRSRQGRSEAERDEVPTNPLLWHSRRFVAARRASHLVKPWMRKSIAPIALLLVKVRCIALVGRDGGRECGRLIHVFNAHSPDQSQASSRARRTLSFDQRGEAGKAMNVLGADQRIKVLAPTGKACTEAAWERAPRRCRALISARSA